MRDDIVNLKLSLFKDPNSLRPRFTGISDRSIYAKLLEGDKVPRHPEIFSKMSYLDVLSEWTQCLQTILNGCFSAGTFDCHVNACASGFLVDHRHQILLVYFHGAGSSICFCKVESDIVVGGASHDCLDPLSYKKLRTEKANGSR